MTRRLKIGSVIAIAAFVGCGIFSVTMVARAEPTDGGVASISLSVGDGGDTTLEVKSGALDVKAGGEKARVTSGQIVRAQKGQKLVRFSALPSPAGLAPGDGAHVPAGDVAFSWSAVAGAPGYHVVIAHDEHFAKPWVLDTTRSDGTATAKLATGTYFWRVSATDRDGLDGKPSPAQKLIVDRAPLKLKTGKPTWQ